MSDDVAITAGAGTTIKTDEVAVNGGASGHVQFVKLVDGTANGTDGLPGSAARGLTVDPRPNLSRLTQTSAGLTTASTAYTAGDQLGSQWSFTSAARSSGGAGIIRAAALLDKADVIGGVDVYLFRASITPASDNAAVSFSDSDMDSWIGTIQLPYADDTGANRAAYAGGLQVPYDCSGGTTLYAATVTRSGHTFFGATSDLRLSLFVEQV